eukprot:GFYU01000389.1.p1 GENE.GFYU01000389.1~~GFYU01000389.1.p1  ORF type:complete len:119 (+),score=50.19 GFYU01000389.1:79-435(+)
MPQGQKLFKGAKSKQQPHKKKPQAHTKKQRSKTTKKGTLVFETTNKDLLAERDMTKAINKNIEEIARSRAVNAGNRIKMIEANPDNILSPKSVVVRGNPSAPDAGPSKVQKQYKKLTS